MPTPTDNSSTYMRAALKAIETQKPHAHDRTSSASSTPRDSANQHYAQQLQAARYDRALGQGRN